MKVIKDDILITKTQTYKYLFADNISPTNDCGDQ